MFRLFNEWNDTLALAEIKAGQHLSMAEAADSKAFFKKMEFKNSCPWSIFLIQEDAVYWGKSNKKEEVPKGSFFVSSRQEIEDNFVASEEGLFKTKLDVIQRHIRRHFEEIDGTKYTLLEADYADVKLLDNTHFEFLIDVKVKMKMMTRVPKTSEGQTQVKLVLRSHNFSKVNVRIA